MAEQEKVTENGGASAKAAKLELAQKPAEKAGEAGLAVRDTDAPAKFHYLGERYVAPGAIEVVESFASAGLRPIAASHLEVFGTILNGRPIMATPELRVMEYAVPGSRPIFASDFVGVEDMSLPGGRPVMKSDPSLMEGSLLPGGRPIASNEIDDSETLMGFLD